MPDPSNRVNPSAVRHQLQAAAVLGNCLNSHTCEILTFQNIFICCQATCYHTSVNAALKLHSPVFACPVHHVIDTGLGFLGFGSSPHTPTPNYQWTQQQNHKHSDEQMKHLIHVNNSTINQRIIWCAHPSKCKCKLGSDHHSH
jgi:hypothetical protein